MNEALIGEEVALETPVDSVLVPLIVDMVEALIEAAGGEPKDLGRLDQDLREAFVALANNGAGDRVYARLVLISDGLEVRLQHDRDSDVSATIVCPA